MIERLAASGCADALELVTASMMQGAWFFRGSSSSNVLRGGAQACSLRLEVEALGSLRAISAS
eukprot:CAMPEP_0170569838 /NCGR_PEP_ID=MMETSP0224-20130122/777_1 /TAXON_ID=285029 /ORGANISM="Togula jolla, Strain CCCM 725" /LENGTH=62 /DNA_ID=CAMNT_0010892049 /DNA_START=406 /DNA_END=594 /DNA_ORIENTATION=+